MNSLIKSAARYKAITFLVVFIIIAAGIHSYLTLPQNEDPKLILNGMQIFIFWPGATPEEVELYVTKPLESAVSKQDYIDKITTESLPGTSTAMIMFSDYINEAEIKRSFQDVRNYVNDISDELPPGVIIFINDRFGETEAYVLALSSESGNRSYRELKAIMEKVKEELKSVAGVGDFNYYGERPEKIYVQFSSEDLASLDVNPGHIAIAIQKQNSQMAQPKLNISGKEILIETTGNYESVEQVRNTIVYTDKEGRNYSIRDLKGKVKLGYDDPPGEKTRVNGQKTLIMTVTMKRGYHIVNWGKKIDRKLENVRSRLPADVKLKTVFNQPKGVDLAVKGVYGKFHPVCGPGCAGFRSRYGTEKRRYRKRFHSAYHPCNFFLDESFQH